MQRHHRKIISKGAISIMTTIKLCQGIYFAIFWQNNGEEHNHKMQVCTYILCSFSSKNLLYNLNMQFRARYARYIIANIVLYSYIVFHEYAALTLSFRACFLQWINFSLYTIKCTFIENNLYFFSKEDLNVKKVKIAIKTKGFY